MKVLVAGAGGAIGLPVVRRLAAEGHQVTGLVRSRESASRVATAGGTPLIADVLDRSEVHAAVAAARPEVVIDQLTALPRNYTPEAMRAALVRSNDVRVVGGANVQRAALRAGARRFLGQSGAYFYEPGPGLATEAERFVADGPPMVAANVEAFQRVERRIAELPEGVAGLVLRYGFFYGPGTWYSPDGDIGRQARDGQLAVLGDGSGVWSFVHLDDAAEFTVRAAVDSVATGVVNVTDDDALPVGQLLPAFAAYAGAGEPRRIPVTEQTDPDGRFYFTRMRGAGNRRARQEFGFRPRRLEWLGVPG